MITIKQPSLLLMFSGGLDSLAALHMLRTTQELPIHVHHVNLYNVENRTVAEREAVEAVRDYYGDLDYSECTIQYPSVNGQFFYDTDVTRFIGGYIASRAPILGVAYGRTADDVADNTLNARTQTGNDIFGVLTTAPMLFPVVHMTKQECWDFLPSDLRKLAWSCRRPQYPGGKPTACGRCKTCKAMAKLNTTEADDGTP